MTKALPWITAGASVTCLVLLVLVFLQVRKWGQSGDKLKGAIGGVLNG